MLFYGPPGTGKTSTILALARQLFGRVIILFFHRLHLTSVLSPDNFRSRVLELNASDERGISIVREKVKNFARQTPRAQAVASDGKEYPCPPYKIIILDEADSMTQDAQAALRRIMETYARITRFCLICNYVTRSADAQLSRREDANAPEESSTLSLPVAPSSGSSRWTPPLPPFVCNTSPSKSR
jgi:replication factor C subunit 2/4